MSSTVVVRSASGVLFEMDVPAAGHALELWEEKLRKGELQIISEPVEWVEHDGARKLQLAAPAVAAEPEPDQVEPEPKRRGRPPKLTTTVDIDTTAAVDALEVIEDDINQGE